MKRPESAPCTIVICFRGHLLTELLKDEIDFDAVKWIFTIAQLPFLDLIQIIAL